MIIEDEMAVILAESYLNAAFECLSKCFYAEERSQFGGYCTAQMMAAAKLVRCADEVFLFLRNRPDLWDKSRQSLNASAQAQQAIMQGFYQQINRREWRQMRQEERIEAARLVFVQWRQAMEMPQSPRN